MGHSNLNVSLAYLRGLEVAELKEEDMPMVYFNPSDNLHRIHSHHNPQWKKLHSLL